MSNKFTGKRRKIMMSKKREEKIWLRNFHGHFLILPTLPNCYRIVTCNMKVNFWLALDENLCEPYSSLMSLQIGLQKTNVFLGPDAWYVCLFSKDTYRHMHSGAVPGYI